MNENTQKLGLPRPCDDAHEVLRSPSKKAYPTRYRCRKKYGSVKYQHFLADVITKTEQHDECGVKCKIVLLQQ